MQKSGSDFASLKAPPLRILVTGFGSFPGVHDNPTALLIHALGNHRTRLARLGIALEGAVLPVEYAGVEQELETLNETFKPDAILHFGLAARRKFISIETRALNRLSLLHCDAAGVRAPRRAIVPGARLRRAPPFPHAKSKPQCAAQASKPACRQCGRLCLQRDAISFAWPLGRAHGRFHSCAAARACKPAKGGIAEPPPRSREPHPRRPHRDPRHRAKDPPRSCASTRCNACAPRFCEDAREAPGA